MNAEPLQVLKQYWGYDSFLSLQQQAIDAALTNRDSMVVMPTGGGKSLCYQVPAVVRQQLTVVVSPLISLMKDQVDALRENGIAAAALNSSLSTDQQQEILQQLHSNELRLLYVAPERLLLPGLIDFLQKNPPFSIAIDEAHCISSWGHDFRPEYRAMHTLRQKIPNVTMHAFTATATPQVRDDIINQLGLVDPEVLVGHCHRPNLFYHVKRRESGVGQICEVMDRFRQDAGVIYAISRAKVERISNALNQMGYNTLPYHAGLSDQQRADNQNALLNDKIDAIVATVAFGMGIDKSNVRYVIHAEMPKSIEAYQQESGRAGRDGLESECWLFYSPSDSMTWQRIIENSPQEQRERASQAMRHMTAYCTGVTCRHQFLVQHFGQNLEVDCQSCDICLGNVETIDDALITAQKILSCVARCQESFGAAHIVKVLTGSSEAKIVQLGHNQLSTWGLMKNTDRRQVADWVQQLIGQGFLVIEGQFPVLKLTAEGRDLLRGNQTPVLSKTVHESSSSRGKRADSWEGVDRDLFAQLKTLRTKLADSQQVPAFVIFSDATLRDLARQRPIDAEHLLKVNGIGQRKAKDYGQQVLELIQDFCGQSDIDTNVAVPDLPQSKSQRSGGRSASSLPSASALDSFQWFEAGLNVETVAEKMQRATSTVNGYLQQFIETNKVTDASRWVDSDSVQKIESVAAKDTSGRLRPIYDALNGEVDYDSIRIVLACLKNQN